MVSTAEESFPRGGKKPKSITKRPREEDNLFSIAKPPKPKKSKKNRKASAEQISDESFHSSLQIQGTLSYNKIKEGMIILGCIRHISNFSLEVELPGLTFGRIHITRISDRFTKYLNEKLEDNAEDSDLVLKKMFQIGQFLPVKVLSVEQTERNVIVECTINPRDIYDGKHHSSFRKGMLTWASIQSELDHGYEINLGVKNCRVFLPAKNVDKEKKFVTGEPLWCVINKCDITSFATTLRVAATEEQLKKANIEEITSLDDLIPGVQIRIIAEKITSNGIQGTFLNDYFGYIDETHLKTPLDKLDEYEEGKIMKAFVLFIEPTMKVTFLTMRNPLDSINVPVHSVGDIVSGKIISKGHNGVYMQFADHEKGFVTNKRLISSLPKKPNLDISDSIRLKFPKGSKHNCRILDYNRLSQFYICTVESSVVKEKVFSSQDVGPGYLINVRVDVVKAEGLVVTAGHVKGFVPNLFISNAQFSETFKQKFKEGQRVNARVLHADDDGNVIFTLKQSQVESDKCLTDLKECKRGERYPGVIMKTNEKGAVVMFYNKVRGWINSKYFCDEGGVNPDPAQYFYRGQVVNPWVLGVKEKRVILTLRQPAEFKTVLDLRVGQKIDGIIRKIHKGRLDIRTKNGKFVGVVPVNHLSSTLSLCSAFLSIYKVGDQIDGLICVDSTSKPSVLSRREALALKRSGRKMRVRAFAEIRVGYEVRCSYISSCESGIYVQPFVRDFTENVLIKTKDIAEKGIHIPKFKPYQSIVAKVLLINHQTKEIQLTAKFHEVFHKDVEAAIAYFSEYLADVNYLRELGAKKDLKMLQYKPGERVDCKIQQLGDEGGCVVTLPNEIQGLVSPKLCPDSAKPGQTMKGVYLSQEVKDNYAELCLRKDICQNINVVQDGKIKCSNISSCIAETILIKNNCIIAVLKQSNCNRQLVYIPVYLHENDYFGCKIHYEKHKFKLCICGKVGDCLIGLSKKLFLRLDKNKADLIKRRLANTMGLREEQIKPKANVSVNNKAVEENDDSRSEESTNEADDDGSEADDDSVDDCEEEIKKSEVEDITSNKKRKLDKLSEKITTVNDKTKSNGVCGMISPPPVLSGVSSFFNTSHKVAAESSSDEEEEQVTVKKKKKLTPRERAALIREDEERISKIEKELADSAKAPESAEQFDRVLLGKPNSSELWTKYMALHIAATEFDKARAVAKRALESINVTLVEERLNIWIALLNLENMFGTKESFEKVFEDAVRYNDALRIYLSAIKILAEAGKFGEMEEKIRKVKSKHKQDPTMWLEVARIYYLINKYREARNLKEACLKSIPDKKTQLQMIIRFAIMEFKHGEEEHGTAIFETFLSTEASKVSVWTTYVDQLVKKGRIEEARRALERAVSQRLPLKSMKTLFMKFRMFEEQHGTPDTVDAVKEIAKEYFLRVSKNM